jgi:hypothetical protein
MPRGCHKRIVCVGGPPSRGPVFCKDYLCRASGNLPDLIRSCFRNTGNRRDAAMPGILLRSGITGQGIEPACGSSGDNRGSCSHQGLADIPGSPGRSAPGPRHPLRPRRSTRGPTHCWKIVQMVPARLIASGAARSDHALEDRLVVSARTGEVLPVQVGY